MKVMPPREIMKYVAFKNGEPVTKEGMPMEYRTLFDEYKTMFIEAKKMQGEKNDKLTNQIDRSRKSHIKKHVRVF